MEQQFDQTRFRKALHKAVRMNREMVKQPVSVEVYMGLDKIRKTVWDSVSALRDLIDESNVENPNAERIEYLNEKCNGYSDELERLMDQANKDYQDMIV